MGSRTPDDTIAAISTPLGEGGIGIVRISGLRAIDIAAEAFRSGHGCDLRERSRRVYYGHVVDASGQVIDEVLVHVMRAPHSYTREDVVEINCHGGAGPVSAVLERILEAGARLAGPGEFTQRAFLNGRIDLVQAEAVIDRIQARTKAGLRAAAAAADGVLSKSIHEMRDTMADALAHIEAAVDFPDEDLPDLVDEGLRSRLDAVSLRMRELLDTAEAGRLYREGAAVVIVGKPNVGKSSLFNALLRDARAIVTAIPGTTRDRIEEIITVSGVPVRLADTAGLRPPQDEVEEIGVALARDSIRRADVILLVIDGSQPVSREDESLAGEVLATGQPVVLVCNKRDLGQRGEFPGGGRFRATARVSAKTGEGLGDLEQALASLLLGNASVVPEQGLITRAHQRDSLRRAEAALNHLLAHFGASPEFLSIDLRDALAAVGEITGETTAEDVLNRIFSTFCIGK
ncbi:MAG TPA: tRNA uridine-5-carboxymethylaminomethyl(34) synthesis GTPase MnmE [Candidatus Hydrogenedentes bacterium]|nr:tRNA uridine-5-carboxymethylaminomethyl(34) synthesis GTPase MnmE [Candidatus Hydrogenedentota bacterium]HPG68031.1 tRNA uridine-5-carboxymethylaminomethyl(34) synthesis GTPase MnmE [Candidatus Hydrogenedentota bacterium]